MDGRLADAQCERQRVAQFERYILQHLVSQTDLLKNYTLGAAGRDSLSHAHSHSHIHGHGHPRPSLGFLPLLAESPDLNNVDASASFIDLGELQFSEAGLDRIKKSGSTLFGPQ